MSTEEVQDNQTAPEEVAVPDKFKNSDGSVNNDALLKSYTDLEKDRSRVVSEIDTLRKDLKATKAEKQQAELLEKLVQNTTPKEEEPPSYEQYIGNLATTIAEEMGLEPDDPAVKVAVRLNSESAKASSTWMKDDIKALQEQHQREIEELKGLITTDKSERVKSTPEYVANKGQIDELVEAGMDEGKAIQFVLNKVQNTSDISTPPPSTPSGRVTAEAVVNDYWSSAEEREQMVRLKGEDRVVAMEDAYARRTRGE